MKKKLEHYGMTIVAIGLLFSLGCIMYNIQGIKATGHQIKHTDYQLNITNDSIFILDGTRNVKRIPWDSSVNNELLKDNL